MVTLLYRHDCFTAQVCHTLILFKYTVQQTILTHITCFMYLTSHCLLLRRIFKYYAIVFVIYVYCLKIVKDFVILYINLLLVF
jgi:hypothetical protein